jgi:hypothetical protein
VHVLSAAPPGSAWTFGGSILTFVFPMILFIVVACALYVLYTKPELVPGHSVGDLERPVSYTAVPGQPTAAEGETATAEQGHAAVAQDGQAVTAEQGHPAAAMAEDAQAAGAEQGQGTPAATAEQSPVATGQQGEARIQDGEVARTEDRE